jgi:hypothetical protein
MVVGEGIAVHAVRRLARNLLAGKKLGGALEDVDEGQGIGHHEALHRGLYFMLSREPISTTVFAVYLKQES